MKISLMNRTVRALAVTGVFAALLSAACAHSPRLAPAPVAERVDSVTASEAGRLHAIAVSYQVLRDSLDMPKLTIMPPPSSAAALETMEQMIFFANNKSDLTDSARAILDDKVVIFGVNPAMRIVIVGFASPPGAPAYNMALGLRRAEAAKAYLVSQGIDPIRIEIATRGEGELAVEGHNETANAANRRGQFRLLIANPYLVTPEH